MDALTKEHLLRTLLAWYGDGRNWTGFFSRWDPDPKLNQRSAMERDFGQCARTALRRDTVGNLLKAVCDAHGIALTELGRRAGLRDSEIGRIVQGDDLTGEESAALRRVLDAMIGRQDGQ